MLQKNDIEILRKLFSQHNYIMTTAELTASKLYYADIKLLLDEGLIERVRRGYYHWIEDSGESEIVIINRLFPDAVLCMETAVTLGEASGKIDSIDVRIYDRDRTICDVLRNMNKMDKEIFNKAIQGYVKDSKKNIPNLMKYAKVLRVQKRVKEMIGVWL